MRREKIRDVCENENFLINFSKKLLEKIEKIQLKVKISLKKN